MSTDLSDSLGPALKSQLAADLVWLANPAKTLDRAVEQAAIAHQGQLTKPPGALGRLEAIATTLAAMQGSVKPSLDRIAISVFAADHGVADEGVSAFPQEVTAQMISNFAAGGAAICVLAKRIEALFEVINLGTVGQVVDMSGVVNSPIASSSANFCRQPAMNEEQLMLALNAGAAAVERANNHGTELFVGGEMGIANSTSATALAAAFLDLDPSQLAGPGTGLDTQGVSHKAEVVAKALALHCHSFSCALDVLRCLGGFEIAALAGAYIRSAQLGIPALVDGFISTAAALAAVRIQPTCLEWLLFSHSSAEPGHQQLLSALDAEPLVSLQMRLGEGSGAALVVPLLQSACALHAQMATFSQASVSGKG